MPPKGVSSPFFDETFRELAGSYKTEVFPKGIPVERIQANGEEEQVADFLNRDQCFGHEGMKFVSIKN